MEKIILMQRLKKKGSLSIVFYIALILIVGMPIHLIDSALYSMCERHFESPIHTHGKIILNTGIAYDLLTHSNINMGR